MRTVQYATDKLRKVFFQEKVLQMKNIKENLGTSVKMTVFRKLNQLFYKSSYSHANQYYTLDKIAKYDNYGLWSFKGIHFSENGSLINTIKYLVNISDCGYFASELKKILKVRVQEALLKLYLSQAIFRQQIRGEYLYLSVKEYQIQFEKRKQLIEAREAEKECYFFSCFNSPESHRCFKYLLSILNEKQRRLYIGFESMKLGRGGDKKMSYITGMNVKTIANGREELLSNDITPERIRREGAGRPAKKKRILKKNLQN